MELASAREERGCRRHGVKGAGMGPAFWWAIALGFIIWLVRSRLAARRADTPATLQRSKLDPKEAKQQHPLELKRSDSAHTLRKLNTRPPAADEPVRVVLHAAVSLQSFEAAVPPPTRIPHPLPVRWVTENETVELAGTTVPGGLFYFGSVARSSAFKGEPSVIDPILATSGPSTVGIWSASYWPSYSTCSPTDRRLLLQWLAEGRKDPLAPVGLVFVYFYGLERRLLEDARTQPDARAEVPRIVAEIDRLRRIYTNRSFQTYSADLRDLAVAMYGNPSCFKGRAEAWPGEPTNGVLVALGRHVASGQCLPPLLAYAWARSLDGAPRPGAIAPIAGDLWRLFDIRYREQFGDGIVVPRPKRNLVVDHHGSASNRTRMRMTFDVPDLRTITAPQKPLSAILESCVHDLLPLAKARKRDAPDLLEIAAVTPSELTVSTVSDGLEALRSFAEHALNGVELGIGESNDLLQAASISFNEKINKRDCTLIATAFQKLGLGIEPDVRWLGPKIARGSKVVIYRSNSTESARTPTPDYRLAQLFMQMTVSLASADGDIDELELDQARAYVDSAKALSDAERKRLKAHLIWLTTERFSVAKLLPQLKALPVEQRQAIADAAIRIAAADGRVDSDEMKMLEKIFKAMALDENIIAAELHRVLTGSKVTNVQAQAGELDASAIERKLKETADVQHLLTSIFSNPEEMIAAESFMSETQQSGRAFTPPENANVFGLDMAHSQLLRRILDSAASAIERSVVDDWCRVLGLMPDGALESVNEAAYAAAGDTLFDADDTIVVHEDVRAQLKQAIGEVYA